MREYVALQDRARQDSFVHKKSSKTITRKGRLKFKENTWHLVPVV